MPFPPSQTTVTVIVDGKGKLFPAHYAARDQVSPSSVPSPGRYVLTPDSRDGWRFMQTVDGRWHGVEVAFDR